jgi:TPR repeat protein
MPCKSRSVPVAAVVTALLMTLVSGSSVRAGPYEDAVAAGKQHDRASATRLYEQAAYAGDPRAMVALGDFATSWNPSPAVATAWYRTAATLGFADGEYKLGDAYLYGRGVPKDATQANQWIMRAANQGEVSAQFALGLNYYQGVGFDKNDREAARWFREALRKASDPQTTVGVNYYLGEIYFGANTGALRDYAMAARYFEAVSNEKDFVGPLGAQLAAWDHLGSQYYQGLGVPKDYPKAAFWTSAAANRGYVSAEERLGLLYSLGQGVPRNLAFAAKWTTAAAQQGDADAQLRLGTMYAIGEGVAKDPFMAATWLNVGISRSTSIEHPGAYGKAVALRADLEAVLGPSRVLVARRLAGSWQPAVQRPDFMTPLGAKATDPIHDTPWSRSPPPTALTVRCDGGTCLISEPVVVIEPGGRILTGTSTWPVSGGPGNVLVSDGTLKCSSVYDSSDPSVEIMMPVSCSDGRTGVSKVDRYPSLRAGEGTVRMNDGEVAQFKFGCAAQPTSGVCN